MHYFASLVVVFSVLSLSLATPLANRHSHLHKKQINSVVVAILEEALEILEAESTASGSLSYSSGLPGQNASSAAATSFSRSFSLTGGVPTATALPSINVTISSSTNTSATLSTNITSTLASYSASSSPNATSDSYTIPCLCTTSSLPSTSGSPSTTIFNSSTTAPPVTLTSSSAATPTASASFLRGVNIGNWLVLEKWMDSTNLFSGSFAAASDQWSFDSISGAEEALQTHWNTWFTESDVAAIAATGLNAIRIPIGYWAYDNADTPYIKGADAYLEKAIGWARTHGIKVWVDCHGSPGSQNGFDNSGHSGSVSWQTGNNIDRSISVLKTMAEKYGSSNYSDVVVGLEMVNEPVSWDGNSLGVTQQFAKDGYAAVKAVAANTNLEAIMHDAFEEPATNWLSLPSAIGSADSRTFGMDSHLYQVFDEPYTSLDGPGHISSACGWSTRLSTANATMPMYVGEWSASMNLCINPDGTTYAGTSCTTSGCQCTSWTMDSWNPNLVEISAKFVEAQLDTFEENSSGYFIWAWDGPGAWSMKNLIKYGVMPNPVTSRSYPRQC